MAHDLQAVLALWLAANQLKRTPRTGWVLRGVPESESVADHAFGTAFIAMTLAGLVDQPVDRAKLLTLALIHDLPEALISDIPSPAQRLFPPGAKHTAEERALAELLESFPEKEQLCRWWSEFEERSSVEGRLVRDADRLEVLLQAHVYAQHLGNRALAEFWQRAADAPFELPVSQRLFEALTALAEACGR